MNTETLAFIARQATCFLLGWYVAEGAAAYEFFIAAHKAALVYVEPVVRLLVWFYAGKTVGLIIGTMRARR